MLRSLRRPPVSATDPPKDIVIAIQGFITTNYDGKDSHYPVVIFFDYDFPNSPPLIYSVDGGGLQNSPSTFHDSTGYIHTPLLSKWRINRTKAPELTLLSVIDEICHHFSSTPLLVKQQSISDHDRKMALEYDAKRPLLDQVGETFKPFYVSAKQFAQVEDDDDYDPIYSDYGPSDKIYSDYCPESEGHGETKPKKNEIETLPSLSSSSTSIPSPKPSELHVLRFILAQKLSKDISRLSECVGRAKEQCLRRQLELYDYTGTSPLDCSSLRPYHDYLKKKHESLQSDIIQSKTRESIKKELKDSFHKSYSSFVDSCCDEYNALLDDMCDALPEVVLSAKSACAIRDVSMLPSFDQVVSVLTVLLPEDKVEETVGMPVVTELQNIIFQFDRESKERMRILVASILELETPTGLDLFPFMPPLDSWKDDIHIPGASYGTVHTASYRKGDSKFIIYDME
ncbi:hypothetical protein ADUPG1_008223 [Aduncisulcus paluster]|uniref:UEV domain-containing protein n=1 Tax=Aduncisulcus paluster TaxID=2918883 RepID=A0ABQ5KSI1_9EUKA|nr:hypothetical protein ADUPG1_008223 [Aduncisulcus paluster]